LFLTTWGYGISGFPGDPSYSHFFPPPIAIPGGYTPTEGLSIRVRGWGDFDGWYDSFNLYFPGGNVFYVDNDIDSDDPFGLEYTCYGFPCTPSTPKGTSPDNNLAGGTPNPYGYFYLPFYMEADLSLGTTNAMLAVNPNQIDWSIYFTDVDSIYYMYIDFAFSSIGFGGDPHLETFFGDNLDIDDGLWSVVSTEIYDINILVADKFTRQAVIVSDSESVTLTEQNRVPVVLVNGIPLTPESSDNVFGGVIQYTSIIHNERKTFGSLSRYWIGEVVLSAGNEKIVFHIAEHPGAGLFYEMVYIPHFNHQELQETRSISTHSGLLFSPPVNSDVSRVSRALFQDFAVDDIYQRSFHQENQD
jgi:hypothetical protein